MGLIATVKGKNSSTIIIFDKRSPDKQTALESSAMSAHLRREEAVYCILFLQWCTCLRRKGRRAILELLRELPSDETLSAEYEGILKAEWGKRADNQPDIENRLNRELSRLQQETKKLVMKYAIDDQVWCPIFPN